MYSFLKAFLVLMKLDHY